VRLDRRRVTVVVIAAALVTTVATAAIADAVRGPTTAFAIQAARGEPLYQHSCIECHGDAGQGIPGKTEPSNGTLFQERNPTALTIFDVVRSGRERRLRALTDAQVWDAIAAEIAREGVDLGDQVLGGTNAARVPTGPHAHPGSTSFAPPGH